LNITFLATGLFELLLGACLGHLTVADQGSQLAIRFGPFPLFQRRTWYDDILEAEKGRATFVDGWAIHLSFRGGWSGTFGVTTLLSYGSSEDNEYF
jgi:hypothetical protein